MCAENEDTFGLAAQRGLGYARNAAQVQVVWNTTPKVLQQQGNK